MQVANETTVLGDFANRRFTYGAVTSTFFRRDGRFMVRTDGPDGKLADFGIKYTFGVRPLQQYLIERPGGRLQALSVAWTAIRRISGRTTTRRRIATQRHGRRSPWPAKPATVQALGARAAYERAAADYVAAQRTNADRPEYRTNLGTFFAARRRVSDAEAELRAAIALDWTFVPAYVNLADLYRAERREPDVRRVLEDGLQAVPDDATLHHAFGLALVRAQRTAEALRHIERAAARAPDNPRFVYTYAVGLNSTGRPREAITVLEKALPRHPNDRDMLFALSSFNRDQGATDRALRYAEQLAARYPDDAEAQRLLAQLRARSSR